MTKINPLLKPGSDTSPEINFDPNTSEFLIKGRSIPLEAGEFFSDVITWLESYVENPNETTHLCIDLQYMNGPSVRSILAMLYKLKGLQDLGKAVSVDWYLPNDAEDMEEVSNSLLSSTSVPYRIHKN